MASPAYELLLGTPGAPPGAPYSLGRALQLAQLAQAAGRNEDAMDVASVMAEQASVAGEVLRADARAALAIAFKSALSSLRGTLKMLGLVAQHESHEGNLGAVFAYARRIEGGVLALATRVLAVAVERQGPLCEDALAAAAGGGSSGSSGGGGARAAAAAAAAAAEACVFFYKLGGDYARYVAECHTAPPVVAQHSDTALSCYSKARHVSATHLHPGHPVLLGVVLNFSVFLFEIRRCEEEAYDLAQRALEEAALALLDDDDSGGGGTRGAAATAAASLPRWPPLTPGERRESDAVAGLVRENLRVWAAILELAASAK